MISGRGDRMIFLTLMGWPAAVSAAGLDSEPGQARDPLRASVHAISPGTLTDPGPPGLIDGPRRTESATLQVEACWTLSGSGQSEGWGGE